MGDALGAVFGSATNTEGSTTPDPTAQALNELRLQQLQQLFSGTPYADFASERPDIYGPSAGVTDLQRGAAAGELSPGFSFDDYMQLGLDETSNYIQQIAQPEILSTMALQGLEGGGAVSEAIARATAQIGLPFVQGLPQASMAGAQRSATLFPLMDYDRSLREQDLLRRQGVVTTGLTGLPFTPGSSTEGGQSQPPLFGFFGQG